MNRIMLLECVLTPEERLTRAVELARCLHRRAAVEDRKKRFVKRLSLKIKKIESRVEKLRVAVRAGVEHRDVSVDITIEEGQYRAVRSDTGEVVETRPALPIELQMELAEKGERG